MRRRYPFVALTLAALAGILAADLFSFSFPILAGGVLLAGAAGLASPRGKTLFVLLGVALTLAALHTARIHDPVAEAIEAALAGGRRVASIRGTVVAEPKEGVRTARVQVEISQLRFGLDGEWIALREPVLVRWRGRVPAKGDQVEAVGALRLIAEARNPGEFSFRQYQARRGVLYELATGHERDAWVTAAASLAPWEQAVAAARLRIRSLLGVGLESAPEIAGMIRGMTIGDLEDTPDSLIRQYQASGTLHLFAVSGLQVAMIAAIAWLLFRTLPLGRAGATLAVFSTIWFFALITGFGPSVARATVMSAFVLAATLVERRSFLINSLGAAALLLLVCDSNQLFQAGFQLSFLVVLSIALFASPLHAFLEPRMRPDPFLPRRLYSPWQRLQERSAREAAGVIAASGAAWIGAAPLMLIHFHLLNPIALLSNLVVVPLGFLVLVLAVLAILTGLIHPALAGVFNNANWLLCQAVLAAVGLSAQVPGGHFYTGDPPVRSDSYVCDITVFAVRESSCALIESRDGAWLIDTGSVSDFQYIVQPAIQAAGINRLRGIILTHPGTDHSGGLSDAVAQYKPESVLLPPTKRRFGPFAGLTSRILSAGDTFSLGDGLVASILAPKPGPPGRTADDHSLVLRLQAGNASVLFLSDIGFVAETELARDIAPVDILIRNHHSRDPGGWPGFLQACGAKLRVDNTSSINPEGAIVFQPHRDGAVRIRIQRDLVMADAWLSKERFSSAIP